MNKILVLFALIASVQFSFAQETYTITGKLTNNKFKWKEGTIERLYLYILDENLRYKAIDSVDVNKDLTFKFTGERLDPMMMCFLGGFDNGELIIFPDSDNIECEIDGQYPSGGKVKNSPLTDYFVSYRQASNVGFNKYYEQYQQIIKEKSGEESFDADQSAMWGNHYGCLGNINSKVECMKLFNQHMDLPLTAHLCQKEAMLYYGAAAAKRMWIDAFDKEVWKHPYGKDLQVAIKKDLVRIGKIAPNIHKIKTIDGKAFNLEDHRGKYVILDFWASWCGPCKKELPYLKQALEIGGDKLVIVSISVDKKEDAWRNAVEHHDITAKNWIHTRSLQDDGVRLDLLYDAPALPTIYLLDPDGRIVAKNLRQSALVLGVKKAMNK